LITLAEVTRAYSKFPLPLLDTIDEALAGPEPTLVDQSEGLSPLQLAVDLEPATTPWRPTLLFMGEAVRLYQDGWSVNRIAIKLGIAWESAALLLHKAEVRELRKRS
jgi:hypothetical protein